MFADQTGVKMGMAIGEQVNYHLPNERHLLFTDYAKVCSFLIMDPHSLRQYR